MFPAPPGYEGRPAGEWPVPAMDHAAGGKESAYSVEMGRLILARIEAGETVKAITADAAMASYATVYQWVRVHEDFGAEWRRLRQARARQAIVADAQAQGDRASLRAFKEGLGWVRRRRGGARSSYTVQKGQAVCRRVAAGEPLYKVLADPAMPSSRAVYRWLKTRPAFRRAYVAACDARLEGLQFDIWLAVDRVHDGGDPARGRAEVAHLEGRQGRLVPKKYRALP